MIAFFQGMAYAPLLLFQIWCQPSKAVQTANRKQAFFAWAMLAAVLLIGVLLAFPHYLLYGKWLDSLLVAFTVAVAVAVALAGPVAFALAGAFAVAVALAGPFAVAVALAGAVAGVRAGIHSGAGLHSGVPAGARAVVPAGAGVRAFAGAVAEAFAVGFAFAFAFAFAVAVTGAIGNALIAIGLLGIFFISWAFLVRLFHGESKIIKRQFFDIDDGWFFFIGWLGLCLAGGIGIFQIRLLEAGLCPLSYCFCFLTVSSFIGAIENAAATGRFKAKERLNKYDVPRPDFALAQRASLKWCTLLALACYAPVHFDWWMSLQGKLNIIALGFFAMPLFFLRIPDYLICLPWWFIQTRRMVRVRNDAQHFVALYEKTLLFKHEMMFGELFGLNSILASFARNPDIGVAGAAERVTHAYWFTFQQKQAQKAVLLLGRAPETAHAFIHHLLQEANDDLLRGLAEHSELARCYLDLTPPLENKEKTEIPFNVKLPNRFLMVGKPTRTPQKAPSEPLPRLEDVLQRLNKHVEHRFNKEIRNSLTQARNLLAAMELRELIAIGGLLEQESSSAASPDLPYLKHLTRLTARLAPMLKRLRDVEQFSRMDARREFLRDQQEEIAQLAAGLGATMYPPFSHIWRLALENAVAVIREDIRAKRESARLSVSLANPTLPSSQEDASITFIVTNGGSETARDARLEVVADDRRLFGETTVIDLHSLQAGSRATKTIAVSASHPLSTWVRGHLYFSDRIQDNKSIPFSFQVNVFEEKTAFREITNPYVAGKALSPENELFVERKDVYDFIDRRIVVGGEHHTIALHGLRRTGKSSLLKRIERDGFANPRLKPVYFDMQGIDDERHFYGELAKAVSSERYKSAREVISSFADFRDFMNDAAPRLDNNVPVILMDEFEELQHRVTEGKISSAVFSHLRHLMQHETRMILLFCGAHQIEELSTDYWGAFFNTATYCKISFFSRKDTDWLVREPVKEELEYDDLSMDRIWRLTAGHPYLVQLFCRTLIERLNSRKKRNYALLNDLDATAMEIIKKGNDQFCPWIWKTSELLEKLVLSALATSIEDRLAERANVDGVMEKLSPLEIATRADCVACLHRLESRDILDAADAGYGFPIGLLQRYIFIKHPFQRVRAEM